MTQDIFINSKGYRSQLALFPEYGETRDAIPGVLYRPAVYGEHERLFARLRTTVQWRASYGTRDTITWGASYDYRGGGRRQHPWPGFLVRLAETIDEVFGFLPNNCVANHYPDGNHTIGFHSDQGMEMQDDTGVVILSLGAVRHLVLRRIDQPRVRYHYALAPGSALHMTPASQAEWQHGILRERECGPRISLSFRRLRAPVLNQVSFRR